MNTTPPECAKPTRSSPHGGRRPPAAALRLRPRTRPCRPMRLRDPGVLVESMATRVDPPRRAATEGVPNQWEFFIIKPLIYARNDPFSRRNRIWNPSRLTCAASSGRARAKPAHPSRERVASCWDTSSQSRPRLACLCSREVVSGRGRIHAQHRAPWPKAPSRIMEGVAIRPQTQPRLASSVVPRLRVRDSCEIAVAANGERAARRGDESGSTTEFW
jgi:hypothetical protein